MFATAVGINSGTRDTFDMKHQDIKIVKPLGSGNFGVVNLGTIVSTGASVAVKQCKEAGHQERFLEEALVMKDLDHRNVAKLIGVVSTAPAMIIMELCKETLLRYLQTQGRLLDVSTLIRLSSEAAHGMRYLHGKRIIHRDLAARNCLISSNEDCTVKVFDFGMSRIAKGKDESYKLNADEGQIPIKWTAPEALVHKICVRASDVWSYGILLWEIFSCGETPYSGLRNAEAQELVCNYEYRMLPPKGTPHRVGKLMAECWQLNVQDRPKMVDIVACFEELKASFAALAYSTLTVAYPSTIGMFAVALETKQRTELADRTRESLDVKPMVSAYSTLTRNI